MPAQRRGLAPLPLLTSYTCTELRNHLENAWVVQRGPRPTSPLQPQAELMVLVLGPRPSGESGHKWTVSFE